jgi:hypothetical protein
MLTDDERELLEVFADAAPDEYPIDFSIVDVLYRFAYRSLVSKNSYATRGEAERAFETYRAILVECARVESEQRYRSDPDDD